MRGRSLSVAARFAGVKEIIPSQGCRGLVSSGSNCSLALANLHMCSWFWEQAGCLLNHPTCFLILPGAVLSPSPIQSLSWILQGFMPLSYSILFQEFPRLDSSPLWLPFWLLSHMPHSSATCLKVLLPHLASAVPELCGRIFPCNIFASTVQEPSKGILPLLFIPPLSNPHKKTCLFPGETGKLVYPGCPGINVPW